MDLFRAEVGGGALARDEGVPVGTVGQRAQAGAVAGGRQVALGDELAQPAVGRQQLAFDHAPVVGGQALALGLAESGRQVGDRVPEQGFLGRGPDQRVQLRQHLLHQRAGLDHAGGHALFHVGHGLVEQRRHLAGAAQPVVVVLHGLEWLRAAARTEHRHQGGRAVELVDRLHPARVLLGFQCIAGVAHEDPVAEQVLAGQTVLADRFDLGQPLRGEIAVALAEFGRQVVGQLVVPAWIALEGGLQRIQLQRLLPVVGVQALQLLGLAHRFGGRLGGGFGSGLGLGLAGDRLLLRLAGGRIGRGR